MSTISNIFKSLDADIDSENCEDFSSMTAKLFFTKIMYNMLDSYNINNTNDDLMIKSLAAFPMMGNEWRDLYWRADKQFCLANPDLKYYYPSAFLTNELVEEMKRLCIKENPHIKQDWVLERNTEVIADLIDLNLTEKLVLNFAVLSCSMDYDVRDIFERISNANHQAKTDKFYSRLFSMPISRVRDDLKGFLLNSGFVVASTDLKGFHEIESSMVDVFSKSDLSLAEIEKFLFPSDLKSSLSMQNYNYLADKIAITEKIISNALEQEIEGMNVMLWGVPGTGKTLLALMLAKRNKWRLKVIGDISGADNAERSRSQRIISLRIAMKLYAKCDDVVLLFDEMEDLFRNQKSDDFSKAFINRIIETTKTPIIWTTNDIHILGAAILRRMVYNIEFDVPPADARKSMWKHYARKYNLKIPKAMIDDLGDTYDMVPALIHNAAKITSLSGVGNDQIATILSSLDKLVHFGEIRNFKKGSSGSLVNYDLSSVNADTDMVRLTECLTTAKPRFSLCLYGPPGTGKSEYGRFIASKLNKQVLFKRASDLLDMYVGQNERNIADAFSQASREGKILLIDEGDSFLRDRQKSSRSWESNLVNEMLSQMESHDQPFILTTNMMSDLDQAALRRFTFKIKFDFLKPEQSAKLFVKYFGCHPPADLKHNLILAPGDFANVERKTSILGVKDADEIYDYLLQECKLKPQKANLMGFKV